jgi:osmoprotectant transport system ATP-binding protein
MIEFDAVSKRYGDAAVIDRLSLSIADDELFVLVGASGSGKSTLLRMINRLIDIDGGSLRIDGHDVRELPPEQLRRSIGYAIQSTGLFPHWTIAQNIATVPRLLGWPQARIRACVDEMMRLVQLDGAGMADRYPDSLSGGQQQRVGVARALAADPAIVLMDEPFGALDPLTRDALQATLASIQRDTGKTIVFVTHDMDEALRLGDRIALIDHGRVRQCGTPAELLQQPADDTVRNFVGGAAAGLRLLGVRRVRDSMHPQARPEAPTIDADSHLQQALTLMMAHGTDVLDVRDQAGISIGHLRLADLIVRKA